MFLSSLLSLVSFLLMTLVVKNIPHTYVECPLYHVYDECERFYVAKLMYAGLRQEESRVRMQSLTLSDERVRLRAYVC